MNTVHTRANAPDSITVKAGVTTNIILHKDNEGAVIIYGRGGHLGDFKVIVDSYVKYDLKPKYGANIAVNHIERKKEFLDYLIDTDFGFKINELHIFSHAFGDGLSLGYDDPVLAQERANWIQTDLDYYYANNLPEELYDAIVAREIAILFNEDILYLLPDARKQKLRSQFDSTAFIKIWGCYGGYEGHNYEGHDYWGALNNKHWPKMAIAHGFAKLCNCPAFGSPSTGTHIEVLDNGKWMTSDEYRKAYGKYSSGTMQHRMRPDKGDYVKFDP